MNYISVYIHIAERCGSYTLFVDTECFPGGGRGWGSVDERRREAQMSRLTTWGEEWKRHLELMDRGQLLSICEDLMGQKPNWIVAEQVGRERMERISNNTALSTELAVSRGRELDGGWTGHFCCVFIWEISKHVKMPLGRIHLRGKGWTREWWEEKGWHQKNRCFHYFQNCLHSSWLI